MNDTLLYPLHLSLSLAVALNLVLTFRLAAMIRAGVGQPVVPLTLPFGEEIKNYPFSMTSVQEGKPIFNKNESCVLIFLSSKCKDCKSKIPQLIKLQPALSHTGVSMWLVTAESKSKLEKFFLNTTLLNRAVTMQPSEIKILNPRSASPFYLFINEQNILEASGMIGDDNWNSFISQMQQIAQEAGLSR